MPISFNTGATASDGVPSVPSQALTIPAGVNAGDLVLFVASGFDVTAVETIQVASTGTTPTIIGATQNTPLLGTHYNHGALFSFIAAASDAGKVITASFASADNAEWAVGLGAWPGTLLSGPIDVSGAAVSSGASATITCPNEVTATAGDWAVQIVAAALGGSTFTGGAGFTQREALSDPGSGSTVLIYDSNAPVGPAGTTIGGATFANAGNNNWWVGWTVGLAPAAGPRGGRVQVPDDRPGIKKLLVFG